MENKKEFNEKFKVKYPDSHSIEHLKFVFYQAEKRLDDSHKNFEMTTTKTVTLITLLVALLSAMSAYFFINNDFHGVFNQKLLVVLVVCVYTFTILIYLIKNIQPVDYLPSGSYPRLLLTERPTEINEEMHLKDVYYSELVSYEDRIEHNFSMNNTRLKRVELSITLLIFLPVFGLAIYCFTFLLS